MFFKKFVPHPLIIDRPYEMRLYRRFIEWTLITIVWCIWIFILRPLLAVFFWMLGIRFFLHHMVDLQGFNGVIESSWIFLTMFLLIFLTIRGWNIYNKRKFGRLEKRKFVKQTENRDMEEFFLLPEAALDLLQKSSLINIDFAPAYAFRINSGNNPRFTGRFIPK